MEHIPDPADELERNAREADEKADKILAEATAQAAKLRRFAKESRLAAEAIYASRMDARPSNTGTSANVSADKLTIKDMALEILSFMENGATAQTILTHINRRYPGTNIKRESLSPQLSRLRELGKVELRGKTWFVAGHPWARATDKAELNRMLLPRPASRTQPTDDDPYENASSLVILSGDPPPDDGSPLTRIHIGGAHEPH